MPLGTPVGTEYSPENLVAYDYVNKPPHYTWHPWVEAADLASYFDYNIGVVMTYLFRLGRKPQHEDKSDVEQEVQDLRKCIRHLIFEVNKREGRKPSDPYPHSVQ